MTPFAPNVEMKMKRFYDSLSEKDRRRYAAIEAEKLGHGGVQYVAGVLDCDPTTIRQGREDVAALPEDEADGRVRKKGGRKTASTTMPALANNFNQVVRDHTAGDPCQENVIWTYLSPREIASHLAALGTPVCSDTVRDLLKEFGFGRRKPEKQKTMGQPDFRNEQFENIADWKATYEECNNPIVSMDTKKKEVLGRILSGWCAVVQRSQPDVRPRLPQSR